MKFVLVVLMLAAPAFARADCDHGRWTRQAARAARKWAEQEARTYAMEARREAQHYRNQLRRELRDGLPGEWCRACGGGSRNIIPPLRKQRGRVGRPHGC